MITTLPTYLRELQYVLVTVRNCAVRISAKFMILRPPDRNEFL